MEVIKKHYDVVVVGGGLAGVCAAISSARNGARTALVHDRSMLGGNASSEVRMCICGADAHGTRANARETGIVEEFLLRNRSYNPEQSFSISDTIFWEMTRFQENLDLYLNARVTDVESVAGRIVSVTAYQTTNEKKLIFTSGIFVDSTGDGFVAASAGAEYMTGREAKSEFNEPDAPDEHDDYVMGITLLFKSYNTGKPVKFVKPAWAYTYTEEDLKNRGHYTGAHIWKSKYGIDSGYWWIELGGGELDVIKDTEEIRDELLKVLYGVWDHIKNGGDHGAENYVLDWVQFFPAKRESRRITGDYILTENDLLSSRKFDDAVAYGGWPMDMHAIKGIRNLQSPPTTYIHVPDIYEIPYRCYYSRNIENLMMAGRCISVTHMAHGSTRVMGTCAVGGQAVGTAAALATRKKCSPREVGMYIDELQQQLLKDDCYIPNIKNTDPADKALKCRKITASSFIEGSDPANVVNGIHRSDKTGTNCWQSKSLGDGQHIMLDFEKGIEVSEVIIRFDSNLSKEISLFLFKAHLTDQIPGVPPEIAKDFDIEFISGSQVVKTISINENFMRMVRVPLDEKVACDSIRVTVKSTYGADFAKIFEIRVY